MKPIRQLFLSALSLFLVAPPALAQDTHAPTWHFPLQAAGTATQRTLWGYMGSCTDWPTSSADYGFMAFTAGSNPTFADLLVDAVHTMSPNGGGALHDGFYDAVHYVKEENMLKVTHYQFSTDGKWHSTIVPTLVSDPTLIATETASSRATGKVYGQFYNNALSGFEFGVAAQVCGPRCHLLRGGLWRGHRRQPLPHRYRDG